TMSAMAVLMPGRRATGPPALLLAAGLLFMGFLAKYVVAIYLPFICTYFLLSWRPLSAWVRNVACLVLPLSAACAVYFLAFRDEVLYLLLFSFSYSDLTSNNPVRAYVWDRPEPWLLGGLAALGWGRATRRGRWVALSGAGILLAFQALARPDFDFWKHSVYLIFFLAPLAASALAPLAERVLGLERPGQAGPWKRRGRAGGSPAPPSPPPPP